MMHLGRSTWRRTAAKEKERDGGAGVRCPLQWQTELVGDRVLRPYVPLVMKYPSRVKVKVKKLG